MLAKSWRSRAKLHKAVIGNSHGGRAERRRKPNLQRKAIFQGTAMLAMQKKSWLLHVPIADFSSTQPVSSMPKKRGTHVARSQ